MPHENFNELGRLRSGGQGTELREGRYPMPPRRDRCTRPRASWGDSQCGRLPNRYSLGAVGRKTRRAARVTNAPRSIFPIVGRAAEFGFSHVSKPREGEWHPYPPFSDLPSCRFRSDPSARSATLPQMRSSAGLWPFASATSPVIVTDEMPPKSRISAACGGVADREGIPDRGIDRSPSPGSRPPTRLAKTLLRPSHRHCALPCGERPAAIKLGRSRICREIFPVTYSQSSPRRIASLR
jgi:hypothetical protein